MDRRRARVCAGLGEPTSFVSGSGSGQMIRQVRLAAPREPSLKTKNWLRSRQIAYAKARAAHG